MPLLIKDQKEVKLEDSKLHSSGSGYKERDSVKTDDLLSQIGEIDFNNKSGDTDSLLSITKSVQSQESHESLIASILNSLLAEINDNMFPKRKSK